MADSVLSNSSAVPVVPVVLVVTKLARVRETPVMLKGYSDGVQLNVDVPCRFICSLLSVEDSEVANSNDEIVLYVTLFHGVYLCWKDIEFVMLEASESGSSSEEKNSKFVDVRVM